MKDDDELEMLLNEIPHATSSLNLHNAFSHAHHHHQNNNNLADGHESCQKMNGMYDDKYAYASSPVSGCSSQSDLSSSSFFSGGGRSLSDTGSLSPPQLDSENRFWWDSRRANGSSLIDDLSLSKNFCDMYISGEREGVSVSTGIQSRDHRSVNGDVHKSFQKYRNHFPDYEGFNLSVRRGAICFEREPGLESLDQHNHRTANFPFPSDRLFPRFDLGNSALSLQFYRANLLDNINFPMGFTVPDVSSTSSRANGMNLVEARDTFFPHNFAHLPQLMPRRNAENLLHYQLPMPNRRNEVPFHVRMQVGRVEACTNDGSLVIQGKGTNYRTNRENARFRALNVKSFHHESRASKPQEKCRSPNMNYPFSTPPKFSSLAESRGCIYHIAKDQNGCRFLQRMFDEGTSRDAEIIFNELIDHVVELMMDPFGNYLMQKLLEVCNEEQRMEIVLRVTKEPGELVKISLNTHGTRVVQKLIETLKTRQQILLVISALEPGFLALVKDLNGNHVVQQCLLCFTNEDSKFIFIAAAKYCVDIATHQHGCCVLQHCISHSTGEYRDNLVAEISANGLLLAQDAFGNYVVQFILELNIPSATFKLASQFEGNYVNLSTQKFSSHVVEKCLLVCNDKIRSKIIHELISAKYFEQLLQDPHANYVVQTALRLSEGPLHNYLIDAIQSYKAVSRNSPYCKRIFSHKLLKM